MFPAHLKRKDSELPALSEYASRYVVAGNGVFMERRSPMYATSVHIPRYDLDLESHQEYCRLYCGRIPTVMHRAMLGFFRYAHQVHGGEAALVLLFHPERMRFRWHCPEQTVEMFQTRTGWYTSDSIEFQNPWELPDGYLRFGDAHLHPGSPHPSMLDRKDEEDGLHIIVGHIEKTPSYNIEFVMDQQQFRLQPGAIFEQSDCEPFDKPPRKWLKQIHLRAVRLNSEKHED